MKNVYDSILTRFDARRALLSSVGSDVRLQVGNMSFQVDRVIYDVLKRTVYLCVVRDL